MQGAMTMTALRTASLFRNGANQAVRIPKEFELPGTEVVMRRDGANLVLEPVGAARLLAAVNSLEPWDGDVPVIEDLPLDPVDDL
jgi:antitoxin VapB